MLGDATFSGGSPDAFEPLGAIPDAYRLHFGALCDGQLRWIMPLTALDAADNPVAAQQHVELVLGPPNGRRGILFETLTLQLHLPDQPALESQPRDAFEDALNDLRAALAHGWTLHACIAWGLSDYNPGGAGLFGDLLCFRQVPAAYKRVQTKQDLFAIIGEGVVVQETATCPSFERRPPNTGYRG